MTVKSTDLLKTHTKGVNTHLWHYFPRTSALDIQVPMGELEQEISELVFCLYLMEKFRFDSTELEFISAEPRNLEDIISYFEELYRIMVERPITITLRKGTTNGSRTIQEKLTEDLDLSEASLFSGGVDSTVGMLLLKRENSKVVLSHTKTGTVPYGRARSVLEQSGTGLEFVVSDATIRRPSNWKDSGEAVIHSRGIIFLTNAMLVSNSLGLPKVILPENGPFVLNVETTASDKSTRTTHPILVDKLQEAFRKISGRDIQVEVPFAQWTKAEIMSADAFSSILRFTHSCFYTQGIERGDMCGTCYSCNVRTLSAYASKVEEYDANYSHNLMELQPSSNSNRDKLEILHGVFRYYSKILDDSTQLNDALGASYLGKLYTRKSAGDMLYRFGCDLFLGARRMLDSKSGSELGPIGKYLTKILPRVNQELLDKRAEQLETLSSMPFDSWDFHEPPFKMISN
ncbi:MAG: 7-cyano-7-deazaguanine synthase [Candidatus Thorarchaeota archaeon]